MRASSLPLLLRCPGSLTLPCTKEKSAEAQKGADWGTLAHNWVETGKVKGPNKRTETAFRTALKASGMETRRHEFWPGGGHHEISVALWVGDGNREARYNVDGKYTNQPGWLTGTADYYWWLIDGSLHIDDLKTGKYYPNPPPGDQRHDPRFAEGENRFPQRAKTEQTLLYAAGLCHLLGWDGDVDLSVTHWPRLPLEYRHAPPVRMWDVATRKELDEFWGLCETLESTRVRNNRSLEVLTPGEHCRFCPARSNCMMAQTFE